MKLQILSFLILSTLIAYSQTDNGYAIKKADSSYGVYKSFKSKSLNKEMPVLVFTPASYANSTKSYPVVYALHGVNGVEINEEGLRKLNNRETKIAEAAELFQVIIVTPLVGNTFYINNPVDTTKKYASYIGEDLPNFIDNEYRTIKNRDGRFLAGFSMGGYGAVSLLCRYPDIFSVALSRGGALDLATGVIDLKWDDAAWPIPVLGSYWGNEKRYHLNGCFNLLNKIKQRKDVGIVIEVGKEDFMAPCNRRFKLELEKTTIPYIYAEYPGGHEWNSSCFLSLLSHLQTFRKTIF